MKILRTSRMISRSGASLAAVVLVFLPCFVVSTEEYAYDSANRLISVTYDDGQRIVYDYDVNGNVRSRTVFDEDAAGGVEPNSLTDAWVEFPYGGVELGTSAQPFNTAYEGNVALVGDGTGTLHIRAGTTAEAFVIVKPMTVVAEGGTVRLGV